MSERNRLISALTDGVLDGRVHDMARRRACDINSAGVRRQVDYLTSGGLSCSEIAEIAGVEIPPDPAWTGLTGAEAAVFTHVCAILADQLGVEEAQITPNTDIQADLDADSLDDVELIMALEEEFSILISDADARDNGHSIRKWVTYLVGRGRTS